LKPLCNTHLGEVFNKKWRYHDIQDFINYLPEIIAFIFLNRTEEITTDEFFMYLDLAWRILVFILSLSKKEKTYKLLLINLEDERCADMFIFLLILIMPICTSNVQMGSLRVRKILHNPVTKWIWTFFMKRKIVLTKF